MSINDNDDEKKINDDEKKIDDDDEKKIDDDEKKITQSTASSPTKIIGASIPYGVYYIRTQKGAPQNYCLNLSGGKSGDGVNIQLYDNPQKIETQWIVREVNGFYVIQSCASGSYMDLDGGSTKNGANVQQWGLSSTNTGYWIINNIDPKQGIFTIQNHTAALNNAKAGFVNISGGAVANGTNIQGWDNPGSPDSQWNFYCICALQRDYPIAEGLYNLQNVNTSNPKEYVNVSGGGDGRNAQNIQTYDNPQSEDSQFVVQRVDESDENKNLYNIRYAKSPFFYLNISGASKDNGANVQLYNNPDHPETRFYFDLIDETSLKVAIRNQNSNLFLNCSGAGRGNGTNIQQYSNPQRPETEWYLAPLDIALVNIEYDLDKSNISGSQPDILASITVSAPASGKQTATFAKKESVVEESSFLYQGGFKITVGVEATVEAKIPFIGGGKVKTSSSFETSHNFSKGNKVTTTQEFSWSLPVTAEAGTTVKCNAVVTKSTLNVPYTMIFKSKSVGTQITSNGIWKGVSCWDLKFDYKDL